MSVAEIEEPVPSRSGTWALRFGVLCFALATLPFVWQGVVSWRQNDELRNVATEFFQAVADGRQQAALRQLSPELQVSFQNTKPAATPGTRIQILAIHHDASTATVKLSIGKQGFVLRPTLHLARGADARWKIVGIDGLEVDPQWTKMQDRADDEKLAEQLADGLRAVP